jgi:hypothetical protein
MLYASRQSSFDLLRRLGHHILFHRLCGPVLLQVELDTLLCVRFGDDVKVDMSDTLEGELSVVLYEIDKGSVLLSHRTVPSARMLSYLEDIKLFRSGSLGNFLQDWADIREVLVRKVKDRFCMVYK